MNCVRWCLSKPDPQTEYSFVAMIGILAVPIEKRQRIVGLQSAPFKADIALGGRLVFHAQRASGGSQSCYILMNIDVGAGHKAFWIVEIFCPGIHVPERIEPVSHSKQS